MRHVIAVLVLSAVIALAVLVTITSQVEADPENIPCPEGYAECYGVPIEPTAEPEPTRASTPDPSPTAAPTRAPNLICFHTHPDHPDSALALIRFSHYGHEHLVEGEVVPVHPDHYDAVACGH